MKLIFQSVLKLKGADLEYAMEQAAALLKDYLVPGTKFYFGRIKGRWYWQFEFPQTFTFSLPSDLKVLLSQNAGAIPPIDNKRVFALSDRILVKGANYPFSKMITTARELPLESLYACTAEDFNINIELFDGDFSAQGLKDSPYRISILADNKIVIERLAKFFDAQYTMYNAKSPGLFFVGYSEVQYLFRVPVFADSLMPHLLNMPDDVAAYLSGNPNLLSRHMLIAGLSGSGKTTTLKLILSRILHTPNKIQSLFIADIKGEYGEWSQKEHIPFFEIGRNPEQLYQLGINPFIPGRNLRLSSHIDALAMIFAIGNSSGGSFMLPAYFKLFLEEYYISLLNGKVRKNDWPDDLHIQRNKILNLTGHQLRERLSNDFSCFEHSNVGIVHYWRNHKDYFLRRVFGNSGKSNGRYEIEDLIASRMAFYETSILQHFNYSDGKSIDDFLNRKVCLSLAGLSKTNIQLVISFFSLMSFETLLAGEECKELKNIFVFEEAHLIATKFSNKADFVTIEKFIAENTERMLLEGRSKGIGMILTDQMPGTRLMEGIIANTAIKICHNILGEDGEVMAKAMSVSNSSVFSCLEVGEAFLKMNDSMPGYKIRVRM